jgi:hypothetical protein
MIDITNTITKYKIQTVIQSNTNKSQDKNKDKDK